MAGFVKLELMQQMLRDGGDGWDGPIVHDFSEIIRLLEEEH